MATRPARTRSVRTLSATAPSKTTQMKVKKRAITLGGGGPAAGLHVGVLEALAGRGINFDVWALSCIGAWVGIVYNQFDKDNVERTYEFFRDNVFRDDESYKRFPINTVFGPDWRTNFDALNDFVTDGDNYKDLFLNPYRMLDTFQDTLSLWSGLMPGQDKKKKFKRLDDGDLNRWILNQAMAPNPFIRYLTSMMYLSNVNGLSRINYPDSDFMKSIKFRKLFETNKDGEERPFIFHNAWDLDRKRLALFANRPMKSELYKGPITSSSLCACSALPFVEETVEMDGTTYCEGALIDTVNFESLLEEHPDLDEIWISRIVDLQQIRKPKNLHDGLANLCQLFAATVGEDDVKLFKYHVKYDPPPKNGKKWHGTVIEIHVPGHINFKWNHSNLDKGRKLGRLATQQAIAAYEKHKDEKEPNRPHFINEHPEDDERWRALRDEYKAMRRAAE